MAPNPSLVSIKPVGEASGSINISVDNPVVLNQQANELARITYDEGTLGNVTGELRGVIRKLEYNWKGKEARNCINEVIKVLNAVHDAREVLSNLAYAASDSAVFQDKLNNIRSSASISNTVKKYTYSVEPMNNMPDTPVMFNAQQAETAKTNLEDAKTKLINCLQSVESKTNEIFNNWKAGKNRNQLMNSLNSTITSARKYANGSMNNAIENLRGSISAFKLASNITEIGK